MPAVREAVDRRQGPRGGQAAPGGLSQLELLVASLALGPRLLDAVCRLLPGPFTLLLPYPPGLAFPPAGEMPRHQKACGASRRRGGHARRARARVARDRAGSRRAAVPAARLERQPERRRRAPIGATRWTAACWPPATSSCTRGLSAARRRRSSTSASTPLTATAYPAPGDHRREGRRRAAGRRRGGAARMRTLPFYQVDVFTEQRFGGNPLAVFPDAPACARRHAGHRRRVQPVGDHLRAAARDPQHHARVRIFTPGPNCPSPATPMSARPASWSVSASSTCISRSRG